MAFPACGAGRLWFRPCAGARERQLIGGERRTIFQNGSCGGKLIWYVPGAVMWHIIRPRSSTRPYFRRLSYNVGVTSGFGPKIHGRSKTFILEIAKWAATLVLCCTMTPRKSVWLLRMRWGSASCCGLGVKTAALTAVLCRAEKSVKQIFLVFDFVYQLVDVGPGLLAEGRAYDFDHRRRQ